MDEAKQYIDEGHFAAGSMLPKVQAAVEFAESKPGRQALITLLEKSKRRDTGEDRDKDPPLIIKYASHAMQISIY